VQQTEKAEVNCVTRVEIDGWRKLIYNRGDMDDLHSTDVPSRSVGLANEPRVLRLACAISNDEKRLFIRHAIPLLESLPVALTWLESNGAGVSAARWRELNPHIVLTGWSTGPLPTAWLESRECALRYVCHLAGSVRAVVPRTFIERGGLVTNWGNLASGAVAEHALLLALAALRNLDAWPTVIQGLDGAGSHVEHLKTRSLFGRSVGIHGFGRVARALVPLLRPFGVTIRAYSAGVPKALMQAVGVTPSTALLALFSQSEVLFECEGLTAATTGSVTAEALAALPADAVFVNIARGGLVDEAALVREAASGRIRVALDVVVSGRLTPKSDFCRIPGSVLSPHIGGPTLDQYSRCGDFALRNLARFVQGEPLEAIITVADYDRST
jgi:phosphoglycerate dehydrogenase-like enzyme